jgi:D-sedoheptulose 7-phosphate isomerase
LKAQASSSYIDAYLKLASDIVGSFPHQDVEAAVDMLHGAWERGSTVFTMGNGGSASTATHLAADLSKYACVPGPRRLKAMALVDNIPLVSAWTNDSGFGSVYVEQLAAWAQPGDVLVGISVHGGSGEGEAGPWSQNLPQAVRFARERGLKTLGLSGFGGGALKQMCDVCLVVPIESEPYGTPLVEGFHVLLHHLLVGALRQRTGAGSGA